MLQFLSEEERSLAEAAREFARSELLEPDRTCDREESSICALLPQVSEMGFLSMRLPDELGGLGCARQCYAAIIHELAYASPSTAVTVSVHCMVGELLHRFATDRVRMQLMPHWGLAENLGCFAISEADAGSDPSGCQTIARQRNGDWVLNGSKMWITNGASGRWFVTLAQTEEIGNKLGLCMFLVDGQSDGFERLKIQGKMGIRGSETVSLHLTDVRIPQDHLLGEMGSGLALGLIALDGGRIGIASQATGIAEACLDEMVTYAKHRSQFGQLLASFQAIQQMIADSYVELEAAKALIARACHVADSGRPHTREAAQAKLYASEMASRVADRGVQIHGGSGYVNDYRVEQLYRDARVTRIYEGTSEILRWVIAREILKS